jgi:hypothetical protein
VVGGRPFQRLHTHAIAQVETVLHLPGTAAFLGESHGVPRLWSMGAAFGSLTKARECLAEIGIGAQLTQPQRYQARAEGCGEVRLVRLVETLRGAKQPAERSRVGRAS